MDCSRPMPESAFQSTGRPLVAQARIQSGLVEFRCQRRTRRSFDLHKISCSSRKLATVLPVLVVFGSQSSYKHGRQNWAAQLSLTALNNQGSLDHLLNCRLGIAKNGFNCVTRKAELCMIRLNSLIRDFWPCSIEVRLVLGEWRRWLVVGWRVPTWLLFTRSICLISWLLYKYVYLQWSSPWPLRWCVPTARCRVLPEHYLSFLSYLE